MHVLDRYVAVFSVATAALPVRILVNGHKTNDSYNKSTYEEYGYYVTLSLSSFFLCTFISSFPLFDQEAVWVTAAMSKLKGKEFVQSNKSMACIQMQKRLKTVDYGGSHAHKRSYKSMQAMLVAYLDWIARVCGARGGLRQWRASTY